MTQEKGTVQVGNLRNLLTILSEVARDPKDALAEFVTNARDALILSGSAGGKVSVFLERRKGKLNIRISDYGIGMSRQKLHYVATHICDSDKVTIPNMAGHKGIGIISFLQLCPECHIISRAKNETNTNSLIFREDLLPSYGVVTEAKRMRSLPGTDVYLLNIKDENRRVLTRAKLTEYLKTKYRSALLRQEFGIQLYDNKVGGEVLPDHYKGSLFGRNQVRTKYGFIELSLHLWHSASKRRRVTLVGEGGVTICDDICDIDDFDCSPWNSDQVEGEIRFSPLRPTTDRRGVIRDGRKFPAFRDAIKALEPELKREIEKITGEHEQSLSRQVLTHLRTIFSKILKELEDVDSPVKVPYRHPLGEIGPGQAAEDRVPVGVGRGGGGGGGRGPTQPGVDESQSGGIKRRYRPLPLIIPKEFEESKSHLRSELDRDQKVIYINDAHEDYRRERASSTLSFLNYTVLVTAKEYVIYNNPRAEQVTIGEDMIRYLVRARRHMPKSL